MDDHGSSELLLGYAGGPFSPFHEVTTHEFQKRVASRAYGKLLAATI